MSAAVENADVVIIGGGIAGMVAANRAAQLGKKAIVLEKGREEAYPCNTRWSGGGFHVHYMDPKTPVERLKEEIDHATDGFTKPELRDALAGDIGRLIDWIQAEGVRMMAIGSRTLAPPASTAPGLDWKGRGPDLALRQFEANLNKRGGAIRRGNRATAIEPVEDGMRVTAETDAGTVTYNARNVCIADGGYPASLELIGKYISPAPEKVFQRNAGQGKGDGLQMAQALGAAVTGSLDCFYGHILCRDALTNDKLWPWPYMDDLATAGMAVDANGSRFANEGNGGVFVANCIARSADPMGVSLVFDSQIWAGPGMRHKIPANPHLVKMGGTLHQAGSIEELAGKLGLPAAALAKTVAEYNAAVNGGATAMLSPPRRTDRYKPMPIATAPFYGIPVMAGITYIMGGIAINANGQVLRESGEIIPHLYAAGTATGGIEGGPSVGYTGGLSKSGVTGLRAGEHMAQN